MTRRTVAALLPLLAGPFLAALTAARGQQDKKKAPEKKDFEKKKGGKGGFGGPMGQVRKVVKEFDKDGDGRLNTEERAAAREFLKKTKAGFGMGGKGKGGKGGFGKGKD